MFPFGWKFRGVFRVPLVIGNKIYIVIVTDIFIKFQDNL